MKEITAYKSVDGTLFDDERKAKTYEDDLLGAELDGLLRLFNLDISRNQEYEALLYAMNKRSDLLKAVESIMQILKG
jgi:hypothetical protein